ncbi:hypothetical protein FD724_31745 (plasmid) [Nostoc sp. C057]|uniref:hypothetical protein n=1 Tax=Nostoc sp. C057 TaxID=2576903 RepID=UPI0015C3269F|nr:hypothetical protein [Nostoc sp. C057]QLE52579.1 hypothetical protein FD724_31745 [Nostoc sp. C057]
MSSLEIASSLDGWGIGAIAKFSRPAIVLFLLVSLLCFQHNTLNLELAKPYRTHLGSWKNG